MDQKKYKTPFAFKQEQQNSFSNPFQQQMNKNPSPFPQKTQINKQVNDTNQNFNDNSNKNHNGSFNSKFNSNGISTNQSYNQSNQFQSNNEKHENNQININYYEEQEEDQLQGVINLEKPQEQKQIELNDDNEPPLLEDLGIDIENIKEKWKSVLFFKKCQKQFAEQSDMSGPLLLAIILGILLMMNGKIHFGYIYGFSVLGSVSIYCIMNFLAQQKNLELYNTMSILGYCLLPIVILAFVALFINLTGFIGLLFCSIFISWATFCSTQLFDEALDLDDKKWLVAYPSFLFYSTFVLITIF